MTEHWTKDRFQWLERVYAHPDIMPIGFKLAFILATKYFNDEHDGDAWPSLDTLAKSLGVNERTVRRQIDVLVEAGHLTKQKGGDGKPNRYRMAGSDRTPMSTLNGDRPDTDVHSETPETIQTGHLCHSDRTPVSFQTGHPCPPTHTKDSLEDSLEGKDSLSFASNTLPKDNLNIETEFERFWEAYPRKQGKGAARTAFKRVRKRVSLEAIISGVTSYASDRLGENPRFTKHPVTWLNGECWTDEAQPKWITASGRQNDAKERLSALAEQLIRSGSDDTAAHGFMMIAGGRN